MSGSNREPDITDLATEAINAVNDYERDAARDRFYSWYGYGSLYKQEEPDHAAD